MAESPAHKLGQIIGDELEAAVHEPLLAIAAEFGMHLDYKHERAARGGKKEGRLDGPVRQHSRSGLRARRRWRYELHVRYSNGDEIRADFSGRKRAVEFLRLFEK